jgi:hypothetical protein
LKKLQDLDIDRCCQVTHFDGLDCLIKLAISGNAYEKEAYENYSQNEVRNFFKVDNGLTVFANLKEFSAYGVIFDERQTALRPSYLSLRHLMRIEVLSLVVCCIWTIPESLTICDHSISNPVLV